MSKTYAAVVFGCLVGCSNVDAGGSGGSSGSTGVDTRGDDGDPEGATSSDDGGDSGTTTSGNVTTATSDADGSDAESSSGGEEMRPPDSCGALKNIPSEPGPHIAEIEALGEGQWLELGAPAADPEFGVGRGRAWGGQALAIAPELRGGFFTGEGVHAYVKPDGYGMDDVWFYDINAHAWVVIHPGNHIESFNQRVMDGELSIDANGQLQDAAGDPVPLHVLIHAWDYLTYDTAAHRFVFVAGDGMGEYYMPGLEQVQAGLDLLYAQREGIDIPPMSPWAYSVPDCRWERTPIETPRPSVGGFFGFVYASAIDKYVAAGATGVATYDRESGVWTTVEDSGPRPTGYDHGAAYDPIRNRLYMGTGDGESGPFHIYDIDTATWTAPPGAPTAFRTNDASVMFNTESDVLTIFQYREQVHYTYDPNTEQWSSRPFPENILAIVQYRSSNAMYDPVLDVYFVFNAGDSGDDGVMLVYRHGVP